MDLDLAIEKEKLAPLNSSITTKMEVFRAQKGKNQNEMEKENDRLGHNLKVSTEAAAKDHKMELESERSQAKPKRLAKRKTTTTRPQQKSSGNNQAPLLLLLLLLLVVVVVGRK